MSIRRLLIAIALIVALDPLLVGARIGSSSVVLTAQNFEGFVHESDRVLVDFYDRTDEKWQENKAELETALRKVRDTGCKVPFGKVDAIAEAGLAKKFVPRGNYPQLLWFQHGEPTQYHRSLRTSRHISDFVMALDRDPITTITSDDEVRSYNRAVFAQCPRKSSVFKVLEVVASKHLDTVAFTFRESDKDNITWVDDTTSERYTGEATVNALDVWVRSFLIKSEPIPEGATEPGDAVVVVGKTFEQIVLQKDKDVLIMVYAPWCGFSRKVFPIWEALCKAVQHVPHLVVAKLDGDRNSSPLPEVFSWQAFPTIFMVKAGTREPIIFHGNRTLAEFVRFAQEHGSKKFTVDEEALKYDPDVEEL